MPSRTGCTAALWLALWAGMAAGQPSDQTAGQTAEPLARGHSLADPPVTRSAGVQSVLVAPLAKPVPDRVGLLPPSGVSLPPDPWGRAPLDAASAAVRDVAPPMLAPLQDLARDLLTTASPAPAGSDGQAFFLSRIDGLIALGQLDAAHAMLRRTALDTPDLFGRWFDIALLTGRETSACARLRAQPEATPTYGIRVFCLARTGDWPTAFTTLGPARTLGETSAGESARLMRFLDDLSAASFLPPPERPTPLDFTVQAAVGDPIGTSGLSIAFSHADLTDRTSWQMRAEAAERLAAAGAIGPGALWEIYAEGGAPASGGVGKRAFLAVSVDRALAEGSEGEAARLLARLEDQMASAGLLTPLAQRIADRDALALASPRLALLAGDAQVTAPDPFLAALQDPSAGLPTPEGPIRQAIVDGLAGLPSGPGADLPDAGRTGEALFAAIRLVERGAEGDLDALTDGLAILAAAGQGDLARLAALHLLLTREAS